MELVQKNVTEKVTRVVVVDREGRKFDQKGFEGVSLHLQDDGMTLKVIQQSEGQVQ